MEKRIVIIGTGPTGLGAGNELHKKGYKNWAIYEKNDYVGGLSASFVDDKGFTWDVGGHVIFSHYESFDNLLNEALGDEYLSHVRESWIWLLNHWVPYPFQNNIKYLPHEVALECLLGLVEVLKNGSRETRNFEEWIYATFGKGIAKYFMIPYDFKVWATPANLMQKDWIAERVSVVDLERVLRNVIFDRKDVTWGPNNNFKFPLHGGTGEIFCRIAKKFEDHIQLKKELIKVDPKKKKVHFSDGSSDKYDYLVSTAPLDKFVDLLGGDYPDLSNAAQGLHHNSVFVAGIGVERRSDSSRCWMYFPQDDSPFYRVTNFSHYSPNNVPAGDTGRYRSLMCETSYSEHKDESKEGIIDWTIRGLTNSRLIDESDEGKIVTKYLLDVPYAYPVPTLTRDDSLRRIQPTLEKMDIYSRGRFGAWRYEIGNMDHSVMMGMEIVGRLLEGKSEEVFNSQQAESFIPELIGAGCKA